MQLKLYSKQADLQFFKLIIRDDALLVLPSAARIKSKTPWQEMDRMVAAGQISSADEAIEKLKEPPLPEGDCKSLGRIVDRAPAGQAAGPTYKPAPDHP